MPKPTNAESLPHDEAAGATKDKDMREFDNPRDLDKSLDHGIKETFPGSDPVSVKVSKYAPGDPRGAESNSGSNGPEPTTTGESALSGVTKQAREAAGVITDTLKTGAQGLSENARRMAPHLERGRNVVEETVRANPVPALIIAGLIGGGIALVAYEAMSKSRPKKLRRRAYGADEIS